MPTQSLSTTLKQQTLILGGLLALMWLIELLNLFLIEPAFHLSLTDYGIIPRTLTGLRGIAFAPFLHANLAHLISNSIPFLILGGLLMLHGTRCFWVVTLGCISLGGLGTWSIGAPGNHLGASGLIFGYFGFLLLRALYEKSLLSILLALAAGGLYGGLIWGVLPSQPGVSWESHLCGFIAGVIMAKLVKR